MAYPDLSVESVTCVQHTYIGCIARHCMHSCMCMGHRCHCSSQECDDNDAVKVLLRFRGTEAVIKVTRLRDCFNLKRAQGEKCIPVMYDGAYL